MEGIQRWRYVGELSVAQVALLLADYDPTPFEGHHFNSWPQDVRHDVTPFLVSVRNAVISRKIECLKIMYISGSALDIDETIIDVIVLRGWLRKKGILSEFFLPVPEKSNHFAWPWDEFYAPKLAAALAAWEAVTANPRLLRGKSPKQALETWLTERAKDYDLLNKDGSPNKTGIEEVAKVANWQRAGGVPKTPTPLPKPSGGFGKNEGDSSAKPSGGFGETELDDEIPF